MPPLTRRALLLSLFGGGTALASCSIPTSPPPPPTPTPRPTPTATPSSQRIVVPTLPPRPAPGTPTPQPNDPLLRTRRLVYGGELAGQRGLITCKGDGSDAALVAAGHYGPVTWSPNGEYFLVAGEVPGEERLARQSWRYHESGVVIRSQRLEDLQDTVAWAPDSLGVAVVATRSDARATPDEAHATYLLRERDAIEVALGQRTRPLGWTARGRLVLTATDRHPQQDWEYAPRSLWTASVGGGDRRQVAEGYAYVGLVGSSEAVYALRGHRLYHQPSRPSVERPTRLAILDLDTGQETFSIAADDIAVSGSVSSPAQLPYWFATATVSPRGDQIALWLVPEATDNSGILLAILAVVGEDGGVRWAEAMSVVAMPVPPVWSPTNDALAYATGPDNNPDPANAPVYLRTAIGNTTTLPATDMYSLSWSPDGTWVAYTHEQRLLLSAVANPARTYLLATNAHAPRWRPR